MTARVDLESLSGPAQRLASPTAPEKLQEMAARGIAPGIRPGESIELLVVLSESERPVIRALAITTLASLPAPLLTGALASDLSAAATDALVRGAFGRIDYLEPLLRMPRIAQETVETLAKTGSEAVTELVAMNEERLLQNPRIIELLYMNPKTRMSTAERLVDLATRQGLVLTGIPAFQEAALALAGELIPVASSEPSPDDDLFRETDFVSLALQSLDEDAYTTGDEGTEVVKEKFLPLYVRLGQMTVSQKVRRAMLGTKDERALLVRDSNKLVAAAVVRSPMIEEMEIAAIAKNRNVSSEVLRIISSSPEWLKSYTVKKNLIENPKTPPMLSSKLIGHLREADLRHLAKSKNVSAAVADAARRHLDKRKG